MKMRWRMEPKQIWHSFVWFCACLKNQTLSLWRLLIWWSRKCLFSFYDESKCMKTAVAYVVIYSNVIFEVSLWVFHGNIQPRDNWTFECTTFSVNFWPNFEFDFSRLQPMLSKDEVKPKILSSFSVLECSGTYHIPSFQKCIEHRPSIYSSVFVRIKT